MKVGMILVALLLSSITAVRGECRPSCCTWSSQPYQNTTASLVDGTPRGFARTVIPNHELMLSNPCITTTATQSNQYIEIAIEETAINTNNKFCISINDESAPFCGIGKLAYCTKVPSTTMSIEVFCDDSCVSSDVGFYYRVTLSDVVDFDDEHWCDRVEDFPSGLIMAITPEAITVQTSFVNDAGSYIYSFSLPLLLTLVLMILGLKDLLQV